MLINLLKKSRIIYFKFYLPVKRSTLSSSIRINEARESFQQFFPGIPIILMEQNSNGIPTYQGRRDIVKFLANVHPSRIPWKRYTY